MKTATEFKTSCTKFPSCKLLGTHLHPRNNGVLGAVHLQIHNSRWLSTSPTRARSLLSAITDPGWGCQRRTLDWGTVRAKHARSGNGEAPIVFVQKTQAPGKKNQKKPAPGPKSPAITRPRTKKPTRLGIKDRQVRCRELTSEVE